MKTRNKILFSAALILFVGASVYFSFNIISRPTYEYEQQEDVGGSGLDGLVFCGYNGNASLTELRVEHPMVKTKTDEGTVWVEDESRDVVAVDEYTLVSDEYVRYIYIGPNVRYIDEKAFVYCKSLRAVIVDPDNPVYTSVDGVLYTKDMKTMMLYPIRHAENVIYTDMETLGKVEHEKLEKAAVFTFDSAESNYDFYMNFKRVAPNEISRESFRELMTKGYTAISAGSFYFLAEDKNGVYTAEKYNLADHSCTVPDGVERIARCCFYKCDTLTSVTLPSSLRQIGDMAFFKCWSLSLVELPEGIETLGNDSFSYCSNMRYAFFVPGSMKEIGHHCFYKCDNLEKFFVAAPDEDSLILGGKWQPKGENQFKADPAIFGATADDAAAYNAERSAQDAPANDSSSDAPSDAPDETDEKDEPVETVSDAGIFAKFRNYVEQLKESGVNTTALFILILVVFIPGLAKIALECIRNLFKDDFLMSKKKKERLAKAKEIREQVWRESLEKAHRDLKGDNDNESGDEAKGGEDE